MSTERKIDQKAYETRIPQQIYKLRVRDGEDEKTKEKGHKMHKFVLEVIPKTEGIPTVVNGVIIDGLEFYHQSVLTEKSLKFANKFRNAVGLSEITESDIPSCSAKEAVGLELYAICAGEEETKKDEAGNPLLDPYTNQPIKVLTREIKQIIERPKRGV